MAEVAFPPAPSWFLPNILATREDGSVSYGSKTNLVILRALDGKIIDTLTVHMAHSKKITGVVFSPPHCNSSLQNTIVTCSEDGFVKIWKIDTLVAFKGHTSHSEQKGAARKVTCIDWSLANPNCVVSAAENNTVVVWDIIANTTVEFSFPKLGTTVIACCPFNEKILAAGGKTGQIFIINLVGGGDIVYKLRGHDNAIQSLSWCPVPYNVFQANDLEEEFLLASSCQDKEIYIWRAGSGGKCEIKFQSPSHPIMKKDQYHGKWGNGFSHTALFWSEPYKLYISSNFCELLYFDVKFYLSNRLGKASVGQKLNKESLNSLKLGHCFHSKGLFAIAGTPIRGEVVVYGDTEIKSELKFKINSNDSIIKREGKNELEKDLNWEIVTPKTSSLIWTVGQDRKVLACRANSPTMELVFSYHTLNGTVYCAPCSPHDPNKVAVGVGDGMIRLWNLTEPSGDAQIYWKKIQDKVFCLAWHPTKDGILAYGTSEGRIGLIDTNSNKLPVVFKPNHPQPIFTLTWGPPVPSGSSTLKSEFDLYAVGDDKVSVYNPSHLSGYPIQLGRIVTFPCQKQTDACWKPDYSLLAVGNSDGSICLLESTEFKIVATVYAYKKLIQSLCWHPPSTSLDSGLSPYHGYFASGSTDNDCEVRVFNCIQEADQLRVEKVATLKGHYGHIQSVSWSPHIGCRLISTSADRSVQIWDVISQAPLVNFSLSGIQLFSVWSPIDSDVVLTGGRNETLYMCKVSAETKVCPAPRTKKQKKDTSEHLNLPLQITPKSVETPEVVEEASESESLALAEVKVPSKCTESKMFSRAWKGDANDEIKNCFALLKKEKDESSETDYSLSFLRDEDSYKELVNAEGESYKKANKWTEFYELSLWNGNIKEVLEEKIKSGDLNDFLVSLAPIISPRLWQEACLSYSRTLAEKKLFRRAASYLIACHKIYEAIRLLVDENLYAEALCIARSRLPKSDPVIKDIVRAYGQWLFKNGSLLKACECYIYLEDYLEVSRICGKKSQAEYLSLAALAARKCGASELESLEATNALFKCFESNNFELARRVCGDHDNLKHLLLLYSMYHTVTQLDAGELVLEKEIVSHVKELTGTSGAIFPGSFQKLYQKSTFYKKLRQVYIVVAQELSFAACAEDTEQAIVHLIKSLSTCCRYIQARENDDHPLYKLCKWLCPGDFLSEDSYFNLKDSHLVPKVRSLRAFLCAAIVRNLTDCQKGDELLEYMDVLNELKEDLLDPDSYKYFKNLIEVEACENRLMANRNKVARKKLTDGKGSEELARICPSSTENSVKVNGVENNTKRGATNLEQSSEDYDTELREDVEKDLDGCERPELEIIDGLEEKIQEDLDLLSKLKAEVEWFELVRISSPNPVPVYFMLKKLCEGASECESAKRLLEDLEENWHKLI